MKKITPCLWFDRNAEEAADFYVSVFKNSKILNKVYYSEGVNGKKGALLTVTFELNGEEFMGLNGGADFPFTYAISMFVKCESQEEVDYFWEKLSEGGTTERCGWLKDKFGLSWQIVPVKLGDMLQDKDPEKSKRVMDALLKMDKLNLSELENAYSKQA
jgi:predicted 3-demethylubiquinone-9 3-methyltransferase (glyoxalase superfamily)